MPDLLTQLAQIRQRQGLEPIDSTTIEGFGHGAPPPPPFMPPGPSEQFANDPDPDIIEDEEPIIYQSPLIAAASPSPASAPGTAPAVEMPKFELIICQVVGKPAEAAYRGVDVELNQQEYNTVIDIVLKARLRSAQDAIDARRAEVDGPPASGVTPEEKVALRAPPEAPKRKRGRPRKVQP